MSLAVKTIINTQKNHSFYSRYRNKLKQQPLAVAISTEIDRHIHFCKTQKKTSNRFVGFFFVGSEEIIFYSKSGANLVISREGVDFQNIFANFVDVVDFVNSPKPL